MTLPTRGPRGCLALAELLLALVVALAVFVFSLWLSMYVTPPARAEGWTVQAVIADRAQAHGVSPALMLCMAERESGLDPLAVGDHGQSYGLYQLYRWGGMYPRFFEQGYADLWDTYEQSDFAARAVADGYGPHWTAWRYCA